MAENILGNLDKLWNTFNTVSRRRLFQYSQREDQYYNDFHLLVPGEYIAIVPTYRTYTHAGDDVHISHGLYIIAKVISAQKKNIFHYGKSTLEFHDGTTGTIDGGVNGRDVLFRFFPKEKFYDNRNNENIDSWFEVYSFADRAHLLKCMEMRPKIIAEQKRLEKEIQQRKYEEEARKRRLEEEARRRSASVSDYDLSKAFRGETKASGYDYLHCPKCGTNLRVPLNKGKIEVKCPNCKYTFITTT